MAVHDLAIKYTEYNVRSIKEFHWPTVIDTLPVSMKIYGKKIVLVLVYSSTRQQVSCFIDKIISFLGVIEKVDGEFC